MNVPLLDTIIKIVQRDGKMPVRDRLRSLLDDDSVTDEEKRLDYLFLYSHQNFPEDDMELVDMYVKWIDKNWNVS